jgi:hypothetical protein
MPPKSPPKPLIVLVLAGLLISGFAAAGGFASGKKRWHPWPTTKTRTTSTTTTGTTTTGTTTTGTTTTNTTTGTTTTNTTTTGTTSTGTTTTAPPPPPPPAGKILWRGDYTGGDFSQWQEHQWSRNNDQGYTVSMVGDSSAVVTSNGRQTGMPAAVFTDYAGAYATDNTERSEVAASQSATGSYDGQTWYYAWSTYIPGPSQQWSKNGGNFNVITTLGHGTNGSQVVPLQLGVNALDSGNVFIYAQGEDAQGNNVRYVNTGPLVYDQWIDWVARITWSASGNGVVELWRNGSRVESFTGVTTQDAGSAPYWKQGVYRDGPSSAGFTNTVVHACARRGDSYAAVTGTVC